MAKEFYDYFMIYQGNKKKLIPKRDIVKMVTEGVYTEVTIINEKLYTTHKALKQCCNQIDRDYIWKLGRKLAVNSIQIKYYDLTTYTLTFRTEQTLILTVRQEKILNKLLGEKLEML